MTNTTLLDDEPIASATEDKLGRRAFAENIANLIRRRATARPMVLALHGPWGSGKTSVLNMVREELERADEAYVHLFDPWYFNSEEALLQSFLSEALKAVEKASGKDAAVGAKVKDAILKYRAVLTTALKGATSILPVKVDGVAEAAGAFLDLFKQGPSQLRREIAEAAEKIDKPVVVLVDNIDRLDQNECRLILKLVRLCSDFPNFVYLLAFDRTVVAKMLEPEAGAEGTAFLEKIVQVEIPLPPLSQTQIERVVVDGIKEIAARVGVDATEVERWICPAGHDAETVRYLIGYRESVLEGVIGSLRDAKRFLNSLSATIPLVAGEVNSRDFVILELLRVFFPRVYDDVCRRRYRMAVFDRVAVGMDDERKERLAFFEDMAKDLSASAVRLIGEVFPAFSSAVDHHNIVHTAEDSVRWAMQMRAAHPDYVDLYFQLRIPEQEVPRGEITALGTELASLDESAAMDRYRKALGHYHGAARLRRFLGRCELFADDLPLQPSIGCAKAIGDFANVISLDPEDSPLLYPHEMHAAASLIFVLLRKTQDTTTIGDVVLDITRACPSLEFARTVAVFATSPDENEIISNFKNIDADQIRGALGARIRERFAEEGHDLLAEHPRTWVSIIKWWPDRADLNRYLGELLRKTPSNWEILIRPVCDREPLGQRFIQLQRFPPDVWLLGLLEAAPSASDGDEFLSAFVNTVRLAAELRRELMDMKVAAARIADQPPGTEPSVEWSTPAIEKHWATVEQWPGGAEIIAAYRLWAEVQDQVALAAKTDGASSVTQWDAAKTTAKRLADGLSPLVTAWEERLRSLPAIHVDHDVHDAAPQ